jgi:hypothetical protein
MLSSSMMQSLEVARRVHTSVRVGVTSHVARVSFRTIGILLQHFIVRRAVVIMSGLLALLLVPKSPPYESDSTEEDRTSNSSDHTSDRFLAGGRESTAG